MTAYQIYKEYQGKLALEFEIAGKTVAELKYGDIFIHRFTNKTGEIDFTKGIVVNDEDEMVIYRPVDTPQCYGFGCTHKIVRETKYSSTRLLANDQKLVKKICYIPTLPNLKGNPAYDLMM